MNPTRIAINGFGRIGRNALRCFLEKPQFDVVAINDLTDSRTLAHLFKFDSIHGVFAGTVEAEDEALVVNGKRIPVLNHQDPSQLPWKELTVDVVLEATGKFRNREGASAHLHAGAGRVLISAPPLDDDIKTVVMGINDEILDGTERIFSNASCTTNSAAPLVKLLDDHWGIESAYITTVHSYTTDQSLHDSPHRDLRRARAAAMSIVPTTTGAAKAITRIFPHLNGKFGGAGIRVPVPDGSLTDLTCIVREQTSIEAVNTTFREAATGPMQSILYYTDEPIVSVDVIGNRHSCIFDAGLTSVIGKMVKVVGWYDNEIGYSNRLADLLLKVFNR